MECGDSSPLSLSFGMEYGRLIGGRKKAPPSRSSPKLIIREIRDIRGPNISVKMMATKSHEEAQKWV